MIAKQRFSQLPTVTLLFMLCATVVTAIALASRFHGFRIFDDAYMFLRYADHILAGEGMVWNIGEGPVYGATSLAYVYALIPFRLIFPENGTVALFCSSFFWGIVFLAIMFRLALNTLATEKSFHPFLAGFLFLSLVTAASSLKVHFGSGMETTFVMSYLAACILLLGNMRKGNSSQWLLAALMAFAWLIRPDLIVFSIGIPCLQLLLSQTNRKEWLIVFISAILGTIASLFLAKALSGSWLPMSFYAKSRGIYGPEFAAAYRWKGLGELLRFCARIWPSIILLALGAFIRWPKILVGKSALEKSVLICSTVFAIYYLGFVLQVMGFGQRFYYPLLPFVWFLGLVEVKTFPENLKRFQGLQLQNLPSAWLKGMAAMMATVLVYYGFNYAQHLKGNLKKEPIAVFDAKTTYQSDFTDYWPKLTELMAVEGDFSIATTEVGMPAALFPDHTIHDLAGLNAAKLVYEGLNAENILKYCKADILFLPPPDYVRLYTDLENSMAFQENYLQISGKTLNATLGVALRRDSRYFQQLIHIYEP